MLRDRHEPWYSCPMDLEAHWAPRQDLLAKMLDELGATNCDWRVDLGRGAFWWQRKDGTPVVVASTRGQPCPSA